MHNIAVLQRPCANTIKTDAPFTVAFNGNPRPFPAAYDCCDCGTVISPNNKPSFLRAKCMCTRIHVRVASANFLPSHGDARLYITFFKARNFREVICSQLADEKPRSRTHWAEFT